MTSYDESSDESSDKIVLGTCNFCYIGGTVIKPCRCNIYYHLSCITKYFERYGISIRCRECNSYYNYDVESIEVQGEYVNSVNITDPIELDDVVIHSESIGFQPSKCYEVKHWIATHIIVPLIVIISPILAFWSFFISFDNSTKVNKFIYDEYYYCDNGTIISELEYNEFENNNLYEPCFKASYSEFYISSSITGLIFTPFYILSMFLFVYYVEKKDKILIMLMRVLLYSCTYILFINFFAHLTGHIIIRSLDNAIVDPSLYTYSIGFCYFGPFFVAIMTSIYLFKWICNEKNQ